MTDNVEEKKAEAPVATEEKAPEVNPLEKSLEFTVSSKELEEGIGAALKRYAKKAKLAGFRPGHVPFETVRAMYGHDAYVETLNGLIEREFEKAATAAEWHMVGMPNIEAVKTEETDVLKFKATVECYPEFEVPSFAELELKRYNCPVTDAEVTKTIDVMRKQRASHVVEEGRKAEDTDYLTINFKGTKDGVPFEGGTAENFTMELGAKRMLPDFEANLRGMAVGEKKTFNMTFPADYGAKELAGKEVQFEVEVLKIEKEVLPELDDAFAKTVGQDNVESLKSEVRVNLEREVKSRVTERTKVEVLNAIAKLAPFPAPKAMVLEEQERLSKQMQERMVSQFGIDPKKAPKMPAEIFAEEAKRRIVVSIMLAKMVNDAKLQASEAEVEAFATELAASFEDADQVKSYYLTDPRQRELLTGLVTENKAVEYILGQAKTTDEALSFDKIM